MARGLRTLVEGESVFNDGVAVVLYLIEVGLSLALAYGAYLAAERLEVSGVIAVVVAGLIMGNHGRIFSVSPSTRLSLSHFWEVGAFLINRLIFLLIGLSVERGHLLGHAGRIGVGFLIMLAVRGFVVYGTLGGYRWLARRSFPISWIHVANWAGVRGSIPVALALGLPVGPARLDELQAITLGAVSSRC